MSPLLHNLEWERGCIQRPWHNTQLESATWITPAVFSAFLPFLFLLTDPASLPTQMLTLQNEGNIYIALYQGKVLVYLKQPPVLPAAGQIHERISKRDGGHIFNYSFFYLVCPILEGPSTATPSALQLPPHPLSPQVPQWPTSEWHFTDWDIYVLLIFLLQKLLSSNEVWNALHFELLFLPFFSEF